MPHCACRAGGVEKLYKVFKAGMFRALVKGPTPIARGGVGCGDDDCGDAAAAVGGAEGKSLAW